jgi:hypothetical protein
LIGTGNRAMVCVGVVVTPAPSDALDASFPVVTLPTMRGNHRNDTGSADQASNRRGLMRGTHRDDIANAKRCVRRITTTLPYPIVTPHVAPTVTPADPASRLSSPRPSLDAGELAE